MAANYNQPPYRYEIFVTIYSEFDVNGNPILTSGTNYSLDTHEEDTITLDMSINDINDISTRNSTFSKTITLPDTNNNRIAFGYISNLNVDTSLFNPNKRAACQIFVDTIPVLTGTLQMTGVVPDFISGETQYECVFYSSVIDFYKSMGEKYLTDLVGVTGPSSSQYPNGQPMGLNRYNHNWTIQNVIYSWTQSQPFGYYYPLIDYGRYYTQSSTEIASGFTNPTIFGQSDLITGSYPNFGTTYSYNNSVILTQMYPAIYVKTVVDEIFAEAGYQYNSNFFNSSLFSNLLIPFTNKYLKAPFYNTKNSYFLGNVLVNYVVKVRTGFYSALSTFTNDAYSNPTTSFSVGSYFGYSTILPIIPFTSNVGASEYYYNNTPYNQNIKPFLENITFTTNISNLGTYIPNYGQYLHNVTYSPVFAGNIGYICWATKKSTDSQAILRSKIPLNSYYPISNGTSYININNLDVTTNGVGIDNFGFYSLSPGEYSFIFIQIDNYNNLGISYPPVGTFLGGTAGGYPIDYNLSYEFSDFVGLGEEISIPLNLPANVKQKDFMTSLYKMFNLYVEPSKTNPYLLNIEPRDSYYLNEKNGGPVIKDWTSKIDLNQKISWDLQSNTQPKTQVYTYKLDSDYFNTQYNSFTNRTQGDAILEINNDFNTSTERLELIFSSSVLSNIPGMQNFPVVNLSNQIDATLGYPVGSSNCSIKILQKNPGYYYVEGSGPNYYTTPGLVNLQFPYSYGVYVSYGVLGGDGWQIATHSGTPPYATFSSYPYIGPYDDPYNPSFDLSFNQPLLNYYPQPVTINNNLFTTYYQNQFNELNDLSSRIITCEMYLTPQDIYNFYFYNIIYIELGGNGRYCRVNSISNYDVSGRSTCTVELLTILNNEWGRTGSVPSIIPTTTSTTTTTTTTAIGGVFTLSPYYNLDITGVTGTGLPGFSLPVPSPYITTTPFYNTLPGSNSISVTLANSSGSGTWSGPNRYLSLQENGVEIYRVFATAGNATLGLTNSFNGNIGIYVSL